MCRIAIAFGQRLRPSTRTKPMKSVAINLDQSRSEKLAKLSEATKGNMTNVSIAGEFIEFEQPRLSSTKLAQALLNSAIDKAYAQLPG